MDTEARKAVVLRLTEAMNAREFDRLEEFLTADFERLSPATPDVVVHSPGDFRRFLEMDAASCPDNRVSIETLIAEGDRVAFWATYTGTQTGQLGPFPPSGRRVSVAFSGYFEFEGGRVRRLRVVWDNVDFLGQLGHVDVLG